MGFIEKNDDKYNLLKVCKKIGNCNFYFYEQIKLTRINKSKWYDKFINVIVNDLVTLPSHIKMITFSADFDKPIENYIPSSVTHLTFGYFFDKPIENYISSSVTHLTFGHNFDQPINNCIPSSVTHLTFGYFFEQPIKDCIPSSVTHLIFD